jgi:hypothetical protein
MPLFMDVHERLPQGATALDVAQAHAADVQGGKVFCLVEAPHADAAVRVHREAHGLVADHIYQVEEGS